VASLPSHCHCLQRKRCCWYSPFLYRSPPQSIYPNHLFAGGSNYAVGDTLSFPFPNTVYEPLSLTVTKVGAGGSIATISVADAGQYLQTNLPTLPIAPVRMRGVRLGGREKYYLLGSNNPNSRQLVEKEQEHHSMWNGSSPQARGQCPQTGPPYCRLLLRCQ
jgi:hypothetical protein